MNSQKNAFRVMRYQFRVFLDICQMVVNVTERFHHGIHGRIQCAELIAHFADRVINYKLILLYILKMFINFGEFGDYYICSQFGFI